MCIIQTFILSRCYLHLIIVYLFLYQCYDLGDISATECEDSPTPRGVKDTNGRIEVTLS